MRKLYSYIYIPTLLSNYTQMKMINLSPPTENMNMIQGACGIVGMPAVTKFVGHLWATGGLRLFNLAWHLDFRDQVDV